MPDANNEAKTKNKMTWRNRKDRVNYKQMECKYWKNSISFLLKHEK